MDDKLKIRPLNPEEIECRVGLIRSNGLSLLLYKDARVDQRILDELVGPYNWKREHEVIDGSVYCTVSVRDPESGEWISKQDVGSSSGNTEKEKSLASDSFKRACVNWGIGRELYTAPFIWIGADKAEIVQKNGKMICNERFSVVGISYTPQKEIASLVIAKGDGARAFVWQRKGLEAKPGQRREKASNGGISQKQKSDLQRELKRTGVTMAAVNERFSVGSVDEMQPEVYERLMRALSATATKAA